MDLRVNVITLGVEDIKRSKKFYEDLGFNPSSVSNEHFVAFQLSNLIFCLYPMSSLAEDAMMNSISEGFRGTTISCNVTTKQDVRDLLDQAEKFGAKIIKPAQDVFWGGHSGYFSDLDGHLWEVAWNPHWSIGSDGIVRLPE